MKHPSTLEKTAAGELDPQKVQLVRGVTGDSAPTSVHSAATWSEVTSSATATSSPSATVGRADSRFVRTFRHHFDLTATKH